MLGCLASHARPGTPLDPAVVDKWTKLTGRVVRMPPLNLSPQCWREVWTASESLPHGN